MEFIGSLKEKDNRKALYAALIFMMLMLLFFLLVSLDEPDPPFQEDIIELEFGGELEGGSAASEQQTEEVVEETVTESAEQVDTQDESPVVVASGQGASSSSTNTQEAKPDPVDNSLGFPGGGGGTTGGNGGGAGFGAGDGVNGEGGSGVGEGMGKTNLNRKCIDKGGMPEQTQLEGKVVIDIWVNDKGEVVSVKLNPKTNTPSNILINLAKRYAKTRLYEKLLGAPKQLVGSVTYNFTKE
jgi:hypothetical protein